MAENWTGAKHGDGEYAGNNQHWSNEAPETSVPLILSTPCPFCKGASTEVMAEGDSREKFYGCLKCGSRFSQDVFSQKNYGLSKKTHSAKWDRCVEEVRNRGGVDSPEAVCTEQLGDESHV